MNVLYKNKLPEQVSFTYVNPLWGGNFSGLRSSSGLYAKVKTLTLSRNLISPFCRYWTVLRNAPLPFMNGILPLVNGAGIDLQWVQNYCDMQSDKDALSKKG